jgi:FkbM family methyltransferase
MNAVVRKFLPRGLGARRVLAGPLKGARLVTSWHDYPAGIMGRTERALLAWFRTNARPGQTWLDVGAHYGYTALALSRLVGPTGRVLAFEPVIASAGCIARTRRLNQLPQLTVIPFGLGAPETLTSLRLPATRGMVDSTIDAADDTLCETIQVARFDWLWPMINGGLGAIHGIKIDVQGLELEVLRGMQQALCQQRPKLVVEFHRGVDRATVLDLLRASGYQAAGIPIESDSQAPTPTTDLADDRSYEFLANT